MPSEFDDDWVSKADVDALNLERSLNPNESPSQLAERLISESAPQAAMAIIGIATSPTANDRVRLAAATYIVDRTCGRIGDANRTPDGGAPWDGVFAAVTREVEEAANAEG